MSDSSRGKRRRTPSPEESRRDNRHKRKRNHSRRRENNSNHSSVNEALTQVLASMQDMKKEFTAWTKRVDNIELQLNANSSVRQLIPDEVSSPDGFTFHFRESRRATRQWRH